MASNIFSDLFNPKKRIIVSPAKSNGVYGLKSTTYTTPSKPAGNTSGSVGTIQTSAPKSQAKPSGLYSAITAPFNQAQQQQKALQAYKASGLGAYQNKPTPPPSTPSTPTAPQAPNMQAYYDEAKARQDKLAQDKYNEDKAYNEKLYGNLESVIKGQLANAEGYLKSYEAGTQADIDAERTSADSAKLKKEQEYGQNQRTMMQQRRQQKGELEKQYAALGTVDSYGVGSFTGANTNLETEFGRQSNQNLMAKQAAIDEIDTNFSKYEREVKKAIQLERSKFNDKVLEINTKLAGNQIEKERAIQQAYQELQATEADLNDTWEGLKLQLEQDKYTASKALYDSKAQAEQMAQDIQSTSDEFRQTGKTTTMNDFIFVQKYPDAAKSMEFSWKQGGTTGATQEKQKMTTLIDDILNSNNLGRITGIQGMMPLLPGSKEMTTKAQIDQLKGLLSLENRQKLKGQGAISDREMAMLEKASSIINQGLSESQFKQVLEQLRNELSTGQISGINANVDQLANQYGI